MKCPEAFLAEIVALYTVWQVFGDGPLAFYVCCGVWIAWRCLCLGLERRGKWWPAAAFGILMGSMQAGCGLAYAGDGRSFVCDAGTGLPITPLVLAGALGVATYYARKRHARTTA